MDADDKMMARLLERRAQLDARIQQRRARLEQTERKLDTRRKVLLGAFALESLRRANIAPKDLRVAGASFAEWLVRDADRALFGLEPLAAPTTPAQALAEPAEPISQ